MDRRQFLKHSWYSSLLLASSGMTASLTGCGTGSDISPGFKVLRSADLEFFRAVLTPCLPGVLTPNPGNDSAISQANEKLTVKILLNLDSILSLLNADTKNEFLQLMDLLTMRLTRGLLTGIWSSWSKATNTDIDKFLWRWRDGSLTILSVAYVSITTMLTMAAFQIPQVASQLGYYGPPTDLLVAWDQ